MEILNINMCDIYEIDRYTSTERFEDLTGIPVTMRILLRLRAIFDTAKTRYNKKCETEKKSESMSGFLCGIKKGSRKFRKILETVNKINTPHNINKFTSNVEIVATLDVSKKINKLWTISYLENELRTFIFKLHNNTLSYNLCLSKFVRGKEPYCTFCTLNRNPEPANEPPLHIFYSCPTSEAIINMIFSEFLGEQIEVRRIDYFGIYGRVNAAETFTLTLVGLLLKKQLWDCKMRNTVPEGNLIRDSILSDLRTLTTVSGTVRANIALINIPLAILMRNPQP